MFHCGGRDEGAAGGKEEDAEIEEVKEKTETDPSS